MGKKKTLLRFAEKRKAKEGEGGADAMRLKAK